MVNIWVYILGISMLFCAYSQGQDTTVVKAFTLEEDIDFLKADSLYDINEFEDALTYYKKAQRKSSEIEDSIIISLELAWCYYGMANQTNALVHLEFLLNLNPREIVNKSITGHLSESNHLRSLLAWEQGDLQRTLEFESKALEYLEQDSIVDLQYVNALVNVAKSYHFLGKFEKSSAPLLKAQQVLKEIKIDPSKKMQKESIIYVELGSTYQALMDLERAMNYFKLALSNSQFLDAGILMVVHSKLATSFYNLGKLDSSIVHDEFALKLFDYIPKQDPHHRYRFSGVLINLGSSYNELGQHEKAKDYLQKALRVDEKNLGPNHPTLLFNLNSLIWNTLMSEDFGTGEKYCSRALTISRSTNDIINNDLASSKQYNWASELYLHIGNFRRALLYADSAFLSNELVLKGNSRLRSDYMDFFRSTFLSIECLMELSDSIQIEKKVFTLYDIFLRHVNQLHFQKYGILVIQQIQSLFGKFYSIFYDLQRDSNDEWKDEKLWEISELKKSRSLLSSIFLKNGILTNLPPALQKKEKELRDSIIYWVDKSTNGNSKADTKILILKEKHINLLSQIENNDLLQNLYDLRLDVSLQNVQTNLNGKSVVLSFFIGEENTYLFAFSKDTVITKTIELNHFENLINCHLNQLTKNQESTDSLSLLTDFIIGDLHSLEDEIETLEIIPDGITWDINFAALSLDDLPGARKELGLISEIWQNNFVSRNYSETEFKENAQDYSYLHLALHSAIDTTDPLNSNLIFGEANDFDDGRLYGHEINNMDLNADLVVLSACQSGGGKIEKGEGVMSLARAFAIGGAKSILASKWDVCDNSSPIIMSYFYEGLKSGMRKSEALRMAQRKFLANDADNITSAPLYWSSFFILGDDSPIVQPFNWYPVVLTVLAILIVCTFLFR